jgi:hypothetical protein
MVEKLLVASVDASVVVGILLVVKMLRAGIIGDGRRAPAAAIRAISATVTGAGCLMWSLSFLPWLWSVRRGSLTALETCRGLRNISRMADGNVRSSPRLRASQASESWVNNSGSAAGMPGGQPWRHVLQT